MDATGTEMKKVYIDDKILKSYVSNIARQITIARWRPDYIVGLTRGGLIPATMLSHWMQVPMHTLNVSLRDGSELGPESNLWMAEDALAGKNILIVDDINDSGATLEWIKKDWPSGCFPHDVAWNEVWHENVRFAVLVNNEASEVKRIDYAASYINKAEEDKWIVFPWENWWE
jgi:xanthine phosphoribosyltransferase